MILIVYPPGWVTVYPAQPLGMATLASFLRGQSIPFLQLDLEILAHEVNRGAPDRCIPLDEMLNLRRFSGLLQRPEERASLHRHYASCVESLLAGVDCSKVGAVAFSIIGERQFASACILAGYFRARGIPVMAGGCFVRQHIGRIAPLGIFDLLFAGFDGPAFADACRSILAGQFVPRSDGTALTIDKDNAVDLLPAPHFSRSLSACYRRAVQAMYRTRQEHLILQYLLDRGCTQNCSFCTRFHRRYDRRSADKIVSEVHELAQEHQTGLFSLTTNAVNYAEERDVDLYGRLSQSAASLEWHAYAVPNLIDPHLAGLLAKSGCRILRFGLESASEKMLGILKKQFTAEQAALSFELAHKRNIWVQVNFMVGCPQESEQDIEDNCRFIERHHSHIDSIRINPFFLQRDSDISRHPERYGIRIRPCGGAVSGFDEIGGPDWEHKKQATLRAIDRMYAVTRDHGIGFWGISSHLLLCALHENGSKDEAKSWLTRTHPYLCDNIPPERIQWRIYHAHEPDKCPYGETWEANYGLIYESGLHWPAAPA